MAKCKLSSCPYYGKRIEVPYAGTKDVDVMIVGESPGFREEELKRPFIGKSGNVLDALLDHIGLDRSMVFVANSARCRIDKDNDGKKDQNLALKTCRGSLEKAIEIVKPKIIVAFGAIALQQLYGKAIPILKNRGRMFPSEWEGSRGEVIPVLATVHPAYVLRGAQRGFPRISKAQMSQKERMIFEDFEMITDILSGKSKGNAREIDLTGYTKGVTADWKTFTKAKRIAFDYEATGLNVKDPSFRVLSVAVCAEEGIAKTFIIKRNKAPAGLKRILQNPKISKIVASRGYEEKVSRFLGITPRGMIHDVLVMAHLVDENGSGYDLETLAGVYTPLKRIKDVIGGKAGRAQRIVEADEKTLVEYNGVDADATLRLFLEMKKKLMQDIPLMRYYQKFIMEVQDMLAETYENGCRIDRKALKETEKYLTGVLDEMYETAEALIPKAVQMMPLHLDRIELDRRRLIIDTLFHENGYKLKPKEEFLTAKTKEPKVSKEHLELFMNEKRKSGKFIKAYLTWVQARKFKSTYVTSLWGLIQDDGNIYPETLINRTVTGRTVMLNPPIQVIPSRGELSKLIKRCYAAPRGWLFFGRDLGQSEIRIAGWMSQDPNILGALKAGIDIHIKTAAIVNRVPLEKVTKEMRQKAKAVNFGFLYGMGAAKFQRYAKSDYGLDLTMQECETIRNMFFARGSGYARLLVYHEYQRHYAARHGYARSPIGRRRLLPDVHANDRMVRGGAERQAINMPIQSFSNDLGLIGMFLYQEEIQKVPALVGNVKPMWYIHDAVYGLAKRKVIKPAMALLKDCMEVKAVQYIKDEFNVEIGYPVTSDGHFGPNWADQKEVA
jgi:uracil-DNA glycosylase family 4